MPEELIGIRAYVRWEEAGMPEDTPPEWQAAEYAKARLDLQLEVLNGVTLNDIRRRYNQDTVDGDDEPIFSRGDANVMLDDAAGEAYDKVARMLGLPYPGGPEIEKQALSGNPAAYQFPRSMPGDLNFSFSGLKTAVRYTLEKIGDLGQATPDLCASFQQAVIDVLVSKTLQAIHESGCNLVTLSGGVSCNQAIRSALGGACRENGFEFLACPPHFSTDNAAMIAFAGLLKLQAGYLGNLTDDIDPNLSLYQEQSG